MAFRPMASSRAICFFQDSARRMRNFCMGVMIKHIAQHQRRSLEPGYPPQGAKVRLHGVVAVAGFPGGRLVALDRFHFLVGGQQIVARVGFLPGAVDEELGLEPFAHKTALHVGLHRQDGVDFARRDRLFQLLEIKFA